MQPCRGFAQGLMQTNAGGEIIVIDSAGYGRVTIDKSVAIVAPPGVYGGINVFAGTNGIDISTAGVEVTLRGITINGQGGDHGIRFVQGARLDVDRCEIALMQQSGVSLEASGSLVEIAQQDGTQSRVLLERNTMTGNGFAAYFNPNGSGYTRQDHSFLDNGASSALTTLSPM